MLVEGWNKLWSLLGPHSGAIGTVLAVIGVAVLVFSIIGWVWQRRKGSVSVGGFPWMAVIVGAILAGPTVTLPILLGIGDILINLVSSIINWFTGQF